MNTYFSSYELQKCTKTFSFFITTIGSILHTKTTYNILGELQELAKGLVSPIPEPPPPFPFSGDTYESQLLITLHPPNPGEALKACPLGNNDYVVCLSVRLSVRPSVCVAVL